MKHTKGPWKHNEQCLVQDREGSVLTCFCHSFVEHGDIERDYADARLAAAAPEMLEALINNYRDILKINSYLRTMNMHPYDLMAKEIREIIEKATGLTINEVLNG